MISFFRINDPYRLVIVLLFLILIQVPYMISGQIITIPEIEWQTIGKALAEGKSMFIDIYHPTGPMSAWIYWILSKILPDNYLVYKIIGLILILFQASIFNLILIEHKTHNQNTYLPAFIYAVLMCGLTDFMTLSPTLLSLTFILLAIDLSFRHIEGRRKKDWVVLQIGIYYGLASLCYPLTYLFMISTILSFIFYTNTLIRRYILLIIGFLVPVTLVWLYFFWVGHLNEFYLNLSYLLFPGIAESLLSWETIIAISLIPFIFLLASILKIYKSNTFINYQSRLQNFMILNLLVGLLILVLDYNKAANVLIIFNPAIAFFLTHFFLLFRKRIFSELYFMVFISSLLFLHFSTSFNFKNNFRWIDFSKLYHTSKEVLYDGERVLVIGNDSKNYYKAKVATPFLSWTVSKKYFEELNTYSSSIKIYDEFTREFPEVIIDRENKMVQIMDRIPEINDKYEKYPNGIYRLKKITSSAPK